MPDLICRLPGHTGSGALRAACLPGGSAPAKPARHSPLPTPAPMFRSARHWACHTGRMLAALPGWGI